MLLYRPVKSHKITQKFAENKACIKTDKSGIFPLSPITIVPKRGRQCPVQFADFYKLQGMRGHDGIDFAGWSDEPIYFPFHKQIKWRVINTKDKSGGLGIDFISVKPVLLKPGLESHIKLHFQHISKSLIADKTDFIIPGTPIALMGKTGATSAIHLCFKLFLCDSNGEILDINNGFKGSQDPMDYYDPTFILEKYGYKGYPLTLTDRVKEALSTWLGLYL